MAYYQEFVKRIGEQDLGRLLQLWEEYVSGDQVDVPEFKRILETIKASDIAPKFGSYIETALPYWTLIQDPQEAYEVLRHLIDLQTTHTPLLLEVSLNAIKTKYPNDPHFDYRVRLVNLRGVGDFKGALSHYDLLAHLAKGKYVFHSGGWGTGQVMDISSVRQEVTCEFENVLGVKQISFQNAFKVLRPLADTHFLARRFGDTDQLEEEARQDPVKVIRMLLNDLGPKTAQEIKDLLAEWVIPEEDWVKWWQTARAKLKKDTLIESPQTLKECFFVRDAVVEHDQKLFSDFSKAKSFQEALTLSYNFARDFPALCKKEGVAEKIRSSLDAFGNLTPPEALQRLLFLEGFLSDKTVQEELKNRILAIPSHFAVLEDIPILAIKKRFLVALKAHDPHWEDQFLHLLLALPQNPLKDFIYEELSKEKSLTKLEHRIEYLLNHPKETPESFFWYFQKLLGEPNVLYGDKEGRLEFFEAFFVLLHQMENEPQWKELTKKFYQLLIADRYKVVRTLLEGSPLIFAKELLLLITKCSTLSDHDIKIVRSLVEVAHPDLAVGRAEEEKTVLWTTDAGYERTRARIQDIGTVEIIENAREIEAARALGDLRENSEYKFALEKRARLQSELKFLSEQLAHARILTKADVPRDEVGIGSVVTLSNSSQETITYTILGAWDADPDRHILSYQSKLAEAMLGKREGESFTFRHDSYKILSIKSIFS